MATWTVQVNRFYIETGKVNSKGKPIRVPVTQRKMYVKDASAFLDSGDYRIFVMARRSGITYSLSTIPRILQNKWMNPNGKCETWYKIAADTTDEEGKVVRPYKRDGKPMTEGEFLHWLTVRGINARAALETLLNQEPEPKEELEEAA